MTRRFWDSHDLRTLRALYPHLTVSELQPILRRPVTSIYQKAIALRIRKHAEYWARQRQIQRDRALIDPRLISGRFQPGQAPPNKGKPMPAHVRAKCAATMFKPGQPRRGRAAVRYQPIGTLRVTLNHHQHRTLQRKVNDDLPMQQRWRSVHSLVWEAAHGPVPAGHIVRFKRGQHTVIESEISLDRLEMVSRAQHMQEITLHNLPAPLRKLTQLRGALNRQINRKPKAQESRP